MPSSLLKIYFFIYELITPIYKMNQYETSKHVCQREGNSDLRKCAAITSLIHVISLSHYTNTTIPRSQSSRPFTCEYFKWRCFWITRCPIFTVIIRFLTPCVITLKQGKLRCKQQATKSSASTKQHLHISIFGTHFIFSLSNKNQAYKVTTVSSRKPKLPQSIWDRDAFNLNSTKQIYITSTHCS